MLQNILCGYRDTHLISHYFDVINTNISTLLSSYQFTHFDITVCRFCWFLRHQPLLNQACQSGQGAVWCRFYCCHDGCLWRTASWLEKVPHWCWFTYLYNNVKICKRMPMNLVVSIWLAIDFLVCIIVITFWLLFTRAYLHSDSIFVRVFVLHVHSILYVSHLFSCRFLLVLQGAVIMVICCSMGTP